jgi:exopolysaccharide biosynthesis polyprenyl glycosylphosphotransferase
MLKEKETVIRRSMVILDAMVISLGFFLSYLIRQHFHELYRLDLFSSVHVVSDATAPLSAYLLVLFSVVPLWCLMLYMNGMYESMRIRKLHEVLWIIIKSSFVAILASGTAVFLLKLGFVSRIFFGLFVVINLVLLSVEKITIFAAMHHFRRQGFNFRRLLIVGTGRRAAGFIDKIQSHPEWGLKVLGAIEDEPGRGTKEVRGVPIIGVSAEIPSVLHEMAIDEVVFVVPRLRLNHIENAIHDCEVEGVRATIAVDLFDLKIASAHPTELDGIPLLTFETTVAREWQLFLKRGIDLVLAGVGILFLSPLLMTASVLIKLTSKGPILFKQERVGLHGRRFILYKFRTMFQGAEEMQSQLTQFNEMNGPVFKIKEDPRMTIVGRLLRKFSIDELPQLLNVLFGQMSLIGPRPPIPEEVTKYQTWQRRRLSMRPGITCLWQVNGRNKVDFDKWMKLDLEYLDNWSLSLDLKILIKTIPAVMLGKGAC